MLERESPHCCGLFLFYQPRVSAAAKAKAYAPRPVLWRYSRRLWWHRTMAAVMVMAGPSVSFSFGGGGYRGW